MTRLMLLLLVVASVLLVAPTPFEPGGGRTAVAEDTAAGLMAVSQPQKADTYAGRPVYGWVTAVDGRSITIQRQSRPGEPPLKLKACELLIAGVLFNRYSTYPPYPLWDVRVGDYVEATGALENGVETCFEICIYRRPGGRLGPPSAQPRNPRNYDAVLPRTKVRVPYHEWVNAIQDYEERGIPLPPHLRPSCTHPVPAMGLVYAKPDGTIEPSASARKLAEANPPPKTK